MPQAARGPNTDDAPHQVTVTSAGGLRTEVIERGKKALLKFDTAGTSVRRPPNMKGSIEVK